MFWSDLITAGYWLIVLLVLVDTSAVWWIGSLVNKYRELNINKNIMEMNNVPANENTTSKTFRDRTKEAKQKNKSDETKS